MVWKRDRSAAFLWSWVKPWLEFNARLNRADAQVKDRRTFVWIWNVGILTLTGALLVGTGLAAD